MRRAAGFTLTELAVVLAIVALLMGTLMFTLSAQTEQRSFEDTRRRLENAKELLLAYAIVNGRLPCPARSNSSGAEVRDGAGECKNGAGVEDYYGGTLSDGTTGGLLPAVTIGFQNQDSSGFAVDAWGNRIRYAVAKLVKLESTCASSSPTLPHFVHATNLKSNGVGCKPNDLVVCNVTQAVVLRSACNPSSTAVTNEESVAAIVFSTGKNGAAGPQGANETENVNGQGTVNQVFVSRTPDPAEATGGQFDDILVWIPVGELYARLIAAGVLP